MNSTKIVTLIVLVALALVVVACGGSSNSDPFAYCKSVKTIDAPDSAYTGVAVPDSVANSLRTAMKIPAGTSDPTFSQRTSWRCMDSKVYACNAGANIPCTSKADTSKTPSQAMTDFCKTSPAADVIPATVTGRTTVYDWRCTSGAPAINKTVFTPDAQGFISEFWYALTK